MDLDEIRKKIDIIDSEILSLLDKRMLLSVRTIRIKDKIEDKERENKILASLRMRKDHLLSPSFSEELYCNIMTESKRLQRKNFKLIGFQGEKGAFGEMVCRVFNNSHIPVPLNEFADVFEEVIDGTIDFGVVPIENSTEGPVTQVGHLIMQKNVNIVGDVFLPIHHSLLVPPTMNIKELKAVYSHPQALAQCSKFIAANKLEPRPYSNTASAAAMIARERPNAAGVIASVVCSGIYGLNVIKQNIEDSSSNRTRFLVLSREPILEKGNKCSITFSTRDRARELTSVLNIFKDSDINLLSIISLPSRDSHGETRFLMDLEGNDTEEKIARVLDKVESITTGFRHLGCYRSSAM